MGRAKIPRKSTIVDMTAMCDVAFLLLTFFILATKQKPDEALAVVTPNSISSKVAPDEAILFTLTPDNKVFLVLGDETKKADVLKDFNDVNGLGLSPAELNKWEKKQFIGLPANQIKGFLALANEPSPKTMPGIPIDTANNELIKWVKSIANAYAGGDQNALQEMLLVKGDGSAKYPAYKQIKEAFKANDIFKFRVVTNGEQVPVGSELYKKGVTGGVKE